MQTLGNGNYAQLVDDSFANDLGDWDRNGASNVLISHENGRMKVEPIEEYSGARHNLGNRTFMAGETLTLSFTLDKGTTNKIRVYLQEVDQANNHLGWYTVNDNLASGSHTITRTVVNNNSRLVLRFDKSNTSTDVNVKTNFYLDDIKVAMGELLVLEENNYYPFGLQHRGYNNVVVGTDHKYEYNGKEHQEEFGLSWIDYGWRNFDPSVGRWINVDPLAEDYYEKNPYMYSGNNPVMFVDYDGRDFGVYIDHEKKIITFKAHYVVNSEDENLIKSIASFFNKSGSSENVYVVGEVENTSAYSIGFDVTYEVNDSEPSSKVAGYENGATEVAQKTKGKPGNEINSLVTVASDKVPFFRRSERNQGFTGGNDAFVRKDAQNKKSTGKHEVGHNFGMSHNNGGIMDGGFGVTISGLKTMLSRVGIGDGTSYSGRGSGDSSTATINGVEGSAPKNFTSGTVMTKAKFERRLNRVIKKNKN